MTYPGTSAILGGSAAGPRVLLLVPARTYRAADFLLAAARMGLDLVIASDGALPVGGRPVIPVHPGDPAASIRRLLARSGPVAAVVAADTPMLVLAAAVAVRMGLPHNQVEAVLNATDKARQRQRWAAAGVAQPAFRLVPARAPQDAIGQAAEAVGFPCVVKAVSLSASQGILRADDRAAAVTAARQIRRAASARPSPAGGGDPAGPAPGLASRTAVIPGTAARISASMREASGSTAPGDPVTSRVTTPSRAAATRTAPPRAMTEGRMLRSSAAVTCAARSVTGRPP